MIYNKIILRLSFYKIDLDSNLQCAQISITNIKLIYNTNSDNLTILHL